MKTVRSRKRMLRPLMSLFLAEGRRFDPASFHNFYRGPPPRRSLEANNVIIITT